MTRPPRRLVAALLAGALALSACGGDDDDAGDDAGEESDDDATLHVPGDYDTIQTAVEGYRGSYLTTYRIGDYGIYAFDSVQGLLEHSYTSGSPDAGVYIGQCYPCDAVIDDIVSEYNGLGYSGTNSGGDLYIVNSTFRFNRAGIVPNSGSYELCYPERETTIVGNRVYSNNNPDTPAIGSALDAMGNGILSAGGRA